MKLYEVVKDFLNKTDRSIKKDSSTVRPESVVRDLTDLDFTFKAGSFFDDYHDRYRSNLYQDADFMSLVQTQATKIDQYRQVATDPDVSNAIDEIVNEILFNYDQQCPIKIDVNIDNNKLKDALNECFTQVMNLINIDHNADNIIRSGYIDGQVIFHLTYNKDKVKKGIKSVQMIDPRYFYFDHKDGVYKYSTEYGIQQSLFMDEIPQVFNREEIVRSDFGLHYEGINHSYLENAIKTANMLKTLEDLLIPLRFSRSVSRRVFNVDVGDINKKHAAELMRMYQNKFKYKKYYNAQTGEITNQQHIVSMVEDYWFPNRSGSKGTTVELLNETDGLGEIDDILYFAKKLYRSMNVPTSRIDYNPNTNGGEFSFNTDVVSREDIRFFMFVNRLRITYIDSFKEILRRQVVSKGIMKDKEWQEYKNDIQLNFISNNTFMEKMRASIFNEKLEYFHNVREDTGKLFSVSTIMRKIFNFSDSEIEEEMKTIKAEKKNPLFKSFYEDPEQEGFSDDGEPPREEPEPEPSKEDDESE